MSQFCTRLGISRELHQGLNGLRGERGRAALPALPERSRGALRRQPVERSHESADTARWTSEGRSWLRELRGTWRSRFVRTLQLGEESQKGTSSAPGPRIHAARVVRDIDCALDGALCTRVVLG